jgi:hypothetical protein
MARGGIGVGVVIVTFCFGFALQRGQAQSQNPPDQSQGQQNSSANNQKENQKEKQGDQSAPDQGSGTPAIQPDKTHPDKKESSNPVETAAEKTRQVTVQVGEQMLVHARSWEQSWVTGIYVGQYQPLITLSRGQRRELYLQQTWTTPGAYLKRMFVAGFDQARGVPGQWDDGWGGYAERFASREGQFFTSNTLAALGNAKLGYEPRYDQCRCKGFWPRAGHAILRNFLTYDRSEEAMRPQWALYGGAFGGGLVSTAWKPHPRNAFAEGGRAMLGQAGYGALLNFVIEFSADVNRKLGAAK